MRRALELAARGPATDPNPRVGCVLLDAAGRTLGEGWHRGAGTPHAEVAALSDAEQRGRDVGGATAVVTLEPCNHTGRTGPCAEALREAGVQVLHITGRGKGFEAPATASGPRYVVEEYCDRMDLAYAVADLVVTRSGGI